MKVVAVQWDCRFGDPEFNFNRAMELMEREPGDIYVLPELCLSGYNFNDIREVEDLSEESHGNYARRFMDFSFERNCTYPMALPKKFLKGSIILQTLLGRMDL